MSHLHLYYKSSSVYLYHKYVHHFLLIEALLFWSLVAIWSHAGSSSLSSIAIAAFRFLPPDLTVSVSMQSHCPLPLHSTTCYTGWGLFNLRFTLFIAVAPLIQQNHKAVKAEMLGNAVILEGDFMKLKVWRCTSSRCMEEVCAHWIVSVSSELSNPVNRKPDVTEVKKGEDRTLHWLDSNILKSSWFSKYLVCPFQNFMTQSPSI